LPAFSSGAVVFVSLAAKGQALVANELDPRHRQLFLLPDY